jgi:diacylglycerol O-acyltransferase
MQSRQSDRLSWGDTVFLHLERDGMPLNVASVCIFEGDISFKDCLQFVESKLPLLPRYLKRVVPAPLGLGLPTWEYDSDFDLRRHVTEVALKHGTENELKALAGKMFGQVMDRRHPLWDVTLVRGLKSGGGKRSRESTRSAVIIRLHHCLADGIAGVGIMNTLLDASPQAPRLPRKKLKLPVPKPDDPLTALTNGVVDSYSEFVQRLLSAITDLLSMAQRAGANGNNGNNGTSDEFSTLLPELTAFTERLRFNVIYKGPQKFAWTEIPLADVKAIRQQYGTSVNDVILTIVTATVRRYCELHGDNIKGKLLRIMVPVNLRGGDSAAELGNRISLVPVTIPLDIRPPVKLLAAAHKRTQFLKHIHAAELVSLAGGLIGMFPSSLQAFAGPLASQLPLTPFNLVCTNVPGPQTPLYLLGHRMLQCYPYVPVGGEMALNCAILSYNGAVHFGFSGDVHAAPDLKQMEKLLQESFAELRAAVEIKATRKSSAKKRKAAKPRAAVAVTAPIASKPHAVEQDASPADAKPVANFSQAAAPIHTVVA